MFDSQRTGPECEANSFRLTREQIRPEWIVGHKHDAAGVRVQRADRAGADLFVIERHGSWHGDCEWPDHRDQHDCDDPHQEIQRNSDAHEVGEAVAAGAEDHHVGLIADW